MGRGRSQKKTSSQPIDSVVRAVDAAPTILATKTSSIEEVNTITTMPTFSQITGPTIEELLAKFNVMEQKQAATEEALRNALGENMRPPMSMTISMESKDSENQAQELRLKSQALSIVSFDRQKLLIGQTMRRSLLAKPHFKGVLLRIQPFHVNTDTGVKISITEHLKILSILVHVMQASKMKLKNIQPTVSLFYLQIIYLQSFAGIEDRKC
jgi:hypothetical protein